MNNYDPEELVQDLPPDKYILNAKGDATLAEVTFEREDHIRQLIEFLFQTKDYPREIYRDEQSYILDLTPMKDRLLRYEDLETLYPAWLEVSGRDNNMDEFGMLIDFTCWGRDGSKRNLVMMVLGEEGG